MTDRQDQTPQSVQLEGRVTGLERDMQNMSHAVESLTDTVQTGFAETRRLFEEGESRNISRFDGLHARLGETTLETAKRGQWNPGIVLTAITCAILIGGIFVAFVHMSTTPLQKDITETRDAIDRVYGLEERSLDMHISSKERLARIEAQMELLHKGQGSPER